MKVSTGEKEMSTTMALVRMFTNLLRDKNVSPRLVPIIPDEARTFGMEGFFRKLEYMLTKVKNMNQKIQHN